MENTQEKHYNLISAEILADNLNQFGERLTTFKLVFPRIILAEFNTHRMFNRNSASSRAIPFEKMVKMVKEQPFIPIAWQKDHKGMQGTEYLTDQIEIDSATGKWLKCMESNIKYATSLGEQDNVTKQIRNRLLEPFMYHTVIVTATEWENFFELRCPKYHKPYETIYYRSKKDLLNSLPDVDAKIIKKESTNIDWLQRNKGAAEIHIMDLAEKIWDVYNESKPKQLKVGEWHIPFGEFNTPQKENNYIDWEAKYIHNKITKEKNRLPFVEELVQESIKTRVKIATARCARISYETLGDNPEINYEKDIKLHDDLLAMKHMSPFEHCAVVMDEEDYIQSIKGDISSFNDYSFTRDGVEIEKVYFKDSALGWSRNFKGFKQYREIIENEK